MPWSGATEAAIAVLRRPRQSPRERAKALSYCQPRRGGGVKVLLRYFLTEKVTKRSCPLAGAMVRWDW